ncbi:Ig-like domain-containing protein [Arthrobacter sp. UM1]|uniref:Ig-like domain-containing protein n=1 Tax=Arthrobacter sp. UM1 TaxID=2766776 RepID=UPI001CF641BC|nr:Ig-like domain-containing protein [Arthrobacter sp. UM1]
MSPSPRILSHARTVLAAASLGVGAVALGAPAALAAPSASSAPAPVPEPQGADNGTQTYKSGNYSTQMSDCACGQFLYGGPMSPVFPQGPEWIGAISAFTGVPGVMPTAQLTDKYVPASDGSINPLPQVGAFGGLVFSQEKTGAWPICVNTDAYSVPASSWPQPEQFFPGADGRTVEYRLRDYLPAGTDSATVRLLYNVSVPAVANGSAAVGTTTTWDPFTECHDGGSLVDQNIHGCQAVGLQNIIVYRPSLAVDDAATTPQNTPVTVKVTGNDTIGVVAQGAVSGNTAPSHGTVVYNNDGTYTYTPNTGFSGTDTFTYTITDKRDGHTTTATVTITVPAGPTTAPTPAPSPTTTAAPTSPAPTPSGTPTGSPTASPAPNTPGSAKPATPAPASSQAPGPGTTTPGSPGSGNSGTGVTGPGATSTAPSSDPGSYGVAGADTGAKAQAESRQRTWIGALAAAAAVVAAGAIAFLVRRRNG